MDTMSTVSEVLNVLKQRGYTVDFNLNGNYLTGNNDALKISPNEFVVDKHYRFEGISDPGDEAIVYAISSPKYHIKGTLVNGYGIYADEMTEEMIHALKENMQTTYSDKSDQDFPENKYNEATPLRPEGDRLIDAQMVLMDLSIFQEQIKNEKAWIDGDRNAITLFKSDGMRVVLIALHAGAEMKTHTAPGIISLQVLEGEITFHTERQNSKLGTGQMLTLHEGVPHGVLAHKESTFLLTLSTPSIER